MKPLDDIDLKILRQLQQDGRTSNADLATKVDISQATCYRRTQRLFDEGHITGVQAQIEPKSVGLGAVAMVGVVLDRSTPQSFAAFEETVLNMAVVLECHLVAGDFDYLLKIRVADLDAFNKLHGEQVITLPGVRQTRTFFVMKEVKQNAPLAF